MLLGRKNWAAVLIAVCFAWLTVLPVQAGPEPFPLDAVRPGLEGVGKTTIQGTAIETFDVTVIAVVPQPPPIPALILVEVGGDVIERAGGIASGMSGSPIYVEDQLLGALAYGYALSDHRVGLVTPAGPMLELLDTLPDSEQQDLSEDYAAVELPQDWSALGLPLVIQGFGSRSRTILTDAMEQLGWTVVPGAMTAASDALDDDSAAVLEPGSPFGIQLMRGDFEAASFGTVTYVEGERFVGMGHPLTHQGDVEYFVSSANVHYTLPNLEFPFKIASTGPAVGALYQDRAAGVAGLLNQEPGYTVVEIDIIDKQRSEHALYRVDVVQDGRILTPLVVSSIYQSIDATLDRIGQGTARVYFELGTEELAEPVRRSNMFYSDSDIAVWALPDLVDGLDLLALNEFRAVGLNYIRAAVMIETQRRTASIEQAVPLSFQVEPGDALDVEITLRPYREEAIRRTVTLHIPEDASTGKVTVTARSGGYEYYHGKPPVHISLDTFIHDDEEQYRQVPSVGESLEKLVDAYSDRERNNEIVLEYYPYFGSRSFPSQDEEPVQEGPPAPDMPPEQMAGLAGESAGPKAGGADGEAPGPDDEQPMEVVPPADNADEAVRVRRSTDFVLEGFASFEIEITAP